MDLLLFGGGAFADSSAAGVDFAKPFRPKLTDKT
jgi:hypothetical protein